MKEGNEHFETEEQKQLFRYFWGLVQGRTGLFLEKRKSDPWKWLEAGWGQNILICEKLLGSGNPFIRRMWEQYENREVTYAVGREQCGDYMERYGRASAPGIDFEQGMMNMLAHDVFVNWFLGNLFLAAQIRFRGEGNDNRLRIALDRRQKCLPSEVEIPVYLYRGMTRQGETSGFFQRTKFKTEAIGDGLVVVLPTFYAEAKRDFDKMVEALRIVLSGKPLLAENGASIQLPEETLAELHRTGTFFLLDRSHHFTTHGFRRAKDPAKVSIPVLPGEDWFNGGVLTNQGIWSVFAFVHETIHVGDLRRYFGVLHLSDLLEIRALAAQIEVVGSYNDPGNDLELLMKDHADFSKVLSGDISGLTNFSFHCYILLEGLYLGLSPEERAVVMEAVKSVIFK